MPYLFGSNPEPGAQVLRAYQTPFQGTFRTLPVHLIPEQALYDAHNVVIRNGFLRARAGLASQNPTALAGLPLTGYLYLGEDMAKIPLFVTSEAVYAYQDGTWTARGAFHGDRDHLARVTSLETQEQVLAVLTNGLTPLQQWTPTGGVQPLTPQTSGSTPSAPIPTLADLVTVSGRIVGIRPPYDVLWSNFLTADDWGDGNIARLADTEDALVAIRTLGTLGFVAYKEGTIMLGFSQAGSDASAFRFEHFGSYEGPAGISAIVDVSGTHFYMTPNGRIAAFDGSQHAWILDGLWNQLEEAIDTQFAHRIVAAYNYRHQEVTFVYPRRQDHGACHGLVTLNLPYPTAGVSSFAGFNGSTAFDLSAALSIRLFVGETVPWFAAATGQVFRQDGDAVRDGDASFLCAMQPGLVAVPQSAIAKPFFELHAIRGEDRGLVEVAEVTAHLLEQAGGVVDDKPLVLDLVPLPRQREYYGFREAAPFLGVRLTWDSEAQFEYAGLLIWGRQLA